ncbi:MAG: integration host factor subunit alpha [Pantoea sp. Brub]|nr:integration host factor subunit alpha [Pantoea sp. Brub]
MALTKAEISEFLFKKLMLNKQNSKELVNIFFEEICCILEQGELLKLSGFGKFELKEKKIRPGRNPKTGENIAVTARRVVTFRPGLKFRNRVKNIKDYKQ